MRSLKMQQMKASSISMSDLSASEMCTGPLPIPSPEGIVNRAFSTTAVSASATQQPRPWLTKLPQDILHDIPPSFLAIARVFEQHIEVKDRVYRMKRYKSCFLGGDAVTLLHQILVHFQSTMEDESGIGGGAYYYSREHAACFGRELARRFSLFEHVTKDHLLLDDYFMYRFSSPRNRKNLPESYYNHEHKVSSATTLLHPDQMEYADIDETKQYLCNLLSNAQDIIKLCQDNLVFDEVAALDMMIDNLNGSDSESARDASSSSSPHNSHSSLISSSLLQNKDNRRRAMLLSPLLSPNMKQLARRIWKPTDEGNQQLNPQTSAPPTFSANEPNVNSSTPTEQSDSEHDDDHDDDMYSMLQAAADEFENCMVVKTHRFHGRAYKNTFVGSDACDFLISSKFATNRKNAVQVGQALMNQFQLFRHVTQEHDFEDNYLFYEFTDPSERASFDPVLAKRQSDIVAQLLSSPISPSTTLTTETTVALQDIASKFEATVPVADRTFHLRKYKSCFVGSQAVTSLISTGYASNRMEAVELGRLLAKELNLFEHVAGKNSHELKDDYLFYQFTKPESRGRGGLVTGFSKENQPRKWEIPTATKPFVTCSMRFCTDSKKKYTPLQLQELAEEFRRSVRVSVHTDRFKKYRNTFIGSEAVDWLVHSSKAPSRMEAVKVGRKLSEELSLFHHVTHSYQFADDWKLYRFEDEGDTDSVYSSQRSMSTEKLEELALAMQKEIKIRDRRWYHKVYKKCFLGSDAVTFLVNSGVASTREEAVQVGREMAQVCGAFEHVEGDHELKDEKLYYRFLSRQEALGNVGKSELRSIANAFLENMQVQDRRYRMRVYRGVFVASEAVDWLVASGTASSREEAVKIGRALAKSFNLFEHVTREHKFSDQYLFFRFVAARRRTMWKELDDSARTALLSSSVLSWEEKIALFEQSSRVKMSRSSIPVTRAEKFKVWASQFRRLDPRWRILEYFNEVAQLGFESAENGVGIDMVHPLLRCLHRASVFTVWRPTRHEAIRKMMRGEAVGKGLDIKGKSALRGSLVGYVPFLQISENRHKRFIRTLPKAGTVRLFFGNDGYIAREKLVRKLEEVAREMEETVTRALEILSDETIPDKEEAKEALVWEMANPSIEYIEEYEPRCYGLEIPIRLFWEAYIARQDIQKKPGSTYDTGRASTPAFQDYNIASVLSNPVIATSPKAVIYHLGICPDPLNPHELVMAYEDSRRVLPVASDFDGFLVGTRRVHYDPNGGALPSEQKDILKWCVSNIGKILDSPTRPESWTNRWLEILSEEKKSGFHPKIPQLGFGDPRSYSLMERAVNRLTDDGSVRHGAESFNYYFPQEIDDKFLVVCNTLHPVPWTYMDAEALQGYLSRRIDDGYTFPLNPKWIMCDPGWKKLYDKLLSSDNVDVRNSMEIWFPKEVREELESICKRHPHGFVRGLRKNFQ